MTTMNDKLAKQMFIICLVHLNKIGDYTGIQGDLFVYNTPEGYMTLEALKKRYKVRLSICDNGRKPRCYEVDVNSLYETLTRINNESDN